MEIPRKLPGRRITGEAGIADPREFGATGRAVAGQHRALARVGGAIQDIGVDLARTQQREQDEKDLIYINDALTSAREAWGPKVVEMKARRGKATAGSTEELEAFYKEITKDLIAGAGDEKVRSILESRLYQIADADFSSIDIHERAERKNSVRSGIAANLDSMVQDVGNSPYKMSDALKNVDAYLKSGEAVGVFTEAEIKELGKKYEREIVNAALIARMRKNPEQVIREINAGAIDPFFNEGERSAYIGSAEKYIDLKEKDLEFIRKKWEDKAKEAEELRLTEIDHDLNDRAIAGTLTNTIIHEAFAGGPEFSKKERKKAETAWTKKLVSGDKEGKSAAYGEMMTRIAENPEDVKVTDITRNPELTFSETKELVTWRGTRIGKGTKKDPVRKAAIAEVNKGLDKDLKNGVFGDSKSYDAGIEHKKQKRDFLIWEQNHPDEDPIEYYEKVMAVEKKTWIFDWLAKDKKDPTQAREDIKARDEAVEVLRRNKLPETEANIKTVMERIDASP